MVTPLPATSGPRRERALGMTLHSLDGRHRLEVSGPLPPGWFGAMSHGLAGLGFNIRRASGRRDSRGHWRAEIAFTAPLGGPEVAGVDFRGLLTRPRGPRGGPALVLDSWVLAGPMVDGALVLSVLGRDCVGFLASLLDLLALFSVFPQEIAIETEGAVVRDRFVLRGLGGRRPSDKACEALRRSLDELVVSRSTPDRTVVSDDSPDSRG